MNKNWCIFTRDLTRRSSQTLLWNPCIVPKSATAAEHLPASLVVNAIRIVVGIIICRRVYMIKMNITT